MRRTDTSCLFLLLTLALAPYPLLANADTHPVAVATPQHSDAAISSAVSARLAEDAVLRHASLAVETRGGVVRIAGEVPDVDSATRLIELAEAVEGVEGLNVKLKARE
jgi:osmotically-inducible protein OsmY